MPAGTERFDHLHASYGAALRRLAHVYAAGQADVDDLVQDIWFAIWRALPGFRGDCSERTFIYRIAHNRGLTARSRGRSHDPVDAHPDLADPGAAPDTLADRSLRASRLLRAVRALPDRLREVVILQLEGLGNQEIAAVTGLSESNVGVRLSRARAELRKRLEPLAERT
ncbi:MAG: RNA polymerase sigma factor [Gemmatimonadales bacterium]